MSKDQNNTQRAWKPDRRIERFIPESDRSDVHDIIVNASSDIVFEVAENFDLLSIPAVYAIFWLRARVLGAPTPERGDMKGLVAATRRMGWAELARRPGRELVMGAAVQPWLPAPVFKTVSPEAFLHYAEPEHVKIVWTLEVEPLGPARTRLLTETRVQPADELARRKLRRYWRRARIGIVLVRRLALPAMRREAERRARKPLPDTA